MQHDEIYRLEERIKALKEDFEDLRNLLRTTESEESQASIEKEMERIQELILELTQKLNDKILEKSLMDQEAQL